MVLQYTRKRTAIEAKETVVQVTPSNIGPRSWSGGNRTSGCPAILCYLAFREDLAVEITSMEVLFELYRKSIVGKMTSPINTRLTSVKAAEGKDIQHVVV